MSGTMKLYLENLSQKKSNDSREKTGDKKSKQKELVFISMNESRVRPTSLCGAQLVFWLRALMDVTGRRVSQIPGIAAAKIANSCWTSCKRYVDEEAPSN